jgi:hypothetical protein
MFTALVLVCSLSVTPELASCNLKTALDVMRVPEEFGSPVACAMQDQAYLAQTAIGRNLIQTQLAGLYLKTKLSSIRSQPSVSRADQGGG